MKIAGTTHFGDGVLTEGGILRLYVGGPYDGGGGLPIGRPDASEQLVGQIQVVEGQWSGTAIVIGQQCANNTNSRFCGQAVPAQASGTLAFDAAMSGTERMRGDIQVAAAGGAETWSVDLLLWIDEGPPGEPGQFKETVAEFAAAGDAIITFDESGKFFFQSASSGCVGNGTLSPTTDRSGDASAATLLMENCEGAYAYLNGDYSGLAVATPSSRWDYDYLVRLWLSKPSGENPQAALTLLDEPL